MSDGQKKYLPLRACVRLHKNQALRIRVNPLIREAEKRIFLKVSSSLGPPPEAVSGAAPRESSRRLIRINPKVRQDILSPVLCKTAVNENVFPRRNQDYAA